MSPGSNKDPELIGIKVEGGPDDGRVVIEEGPESVARNTDGVLNGLPKVEPWMSRGVDAAPESDFEQVQGSGLNQYSSLVAEISRKRKELLSTEEEKFVDRLAELGSRTVSYLLSSKLARIPTSLEYTEAAREYKKAAYRYFDAREDEIKPTTDDLAGFGLESDATAAVLDKFAGSTPSVRDNNGSMRRPVEDCAINISTMLDEIVRENGIRNPDNYMIGNLDSIAAHYEKALHTK